MYHLIIIPIITIVVTQSIKIITEFTEKKSWDLSRFNGYGGMPSSHTAFVIALAVEVWQTEGTGSTAFALALALSLIVIRDAVGFRRYLGRHSEVINDIIHKMRQKKVLDLEDIKLRENLGHRPVEALVGGILGAVISIILHPLFI